MKKRQKRKHAKRHSLLVECERRLAEKNRRIAELTEALAKASPDSPSPVCGEKTRMLALLIKDVEDHSNDYHHKTKPGLIADARRVAGLKCRGEGQ